MLFDFLSKSSIDYKKVADVSLDEIDSEAEHLTILSCSILDYYIQLLLSNKNAALLKINPEQATMKFFSFIEVRLCYSLSVLHHREVHLTIN